MTTPSVKIMQGDALEQLRTLDSESIHCVVTSPPYWGMRDYGVDGQLGLEKTPEEYVEKLVEIFREIKRILRNDGTFWLNMGDSYYGSGGSSGHTPETKNLGRKTFEYGAYPKASIAQKNHNYLKPKDLVGTPWRLAFALQADGWYLRKDNIWHKPNPMPESVRDRTTTSHEYVFHFSKSARYYYDQDAIREPFNYPKRVFSPDTSNHKTLRLKETGNRTTSGLHNGRTQFGNPMKGRNKRSVWEIAIRPYSEAHFATFPEELPEICIKAGTSQKGCCSKCGAPWERIIEKTRPETWEDKGATTEKEISHREIAKSIYGETGNQKTRSISDIYGRATKSTIKTMGWQPTCDCDAEIIPCVVLDPFAGSGTTGQVARKLGRSSILIELNPEYIEMIKKRTNYHHKPLEMFSESEISKYTGFINAGVKNGGK